MQFNWTGEAIVAGITNQVSGSLKNVKDADERKGERESIHQRRGRRRGVSVSKGKARERERERERDESGKFSWPQIKI